MNLVEDNAKLSSQLEQVSISMCYKILFKVLCLNYNYIKKLLLKNHLYIKQFCCFMYLCKGQEHLLLIIDFRMYRYAINNTVKSGSTNMKIHKTLLKRFTIN